MNDFLIRPYRPDDEAALRQFLILLQDHERSIRPTRLPGQQVVSFMVKDVAPTGKPDGSEVFVAECQGQVIGFISCFVFRNNREAEANEYVIGNLYVGENWRGRGVARHLMAAASDRGRVLGCTRLVVGALANNNAALAAYRAMGFTPGFIYLERSMEKRGD